MILTFKNDTGYITMSGHGSEQIVIKTITGLGIPQINYESISYYASDGKTTLSSCVSSRIITISGDIYSYDKLFLRKISRVLCNSGTLTVKHDAVSKIINYKPLSFEFTEKHGSIQSFAYQIECDNPYFEDIFYTSNKIYTRIDNIKSPFTLPLVFSSRSTQANVINNGDSKSYPVITISGSYNNSTDAIYTLTNKTTNASLTIKLADTKITIDTGKRTIVNSKGVNTINSLKSGAMGDFYLQKGENVIKCTCSDTNSTPVVSLKYKNTYLEAMF